MNGHLLLLITDRPTPHDQAMADVRAVLDPWPDDQTPDVRHLSLEDALANPARLDDATAAWLVVEQGANGQLFELIGHLQDRHTPALLTRTDAADPLASPYQSGVLTCPPGTAPATAGAMLRALLAQAPVIDELKTELRLVRAHHGGLAGQISRMDEELRLAAQLQREFLPTQMPKVRNLEFRVLWRPAGYVSGDIYDVVRLDEHHVGLFIADAVGHGVPAALMTMFIKRSLPTKRIDASLPAGYRLVEPREALAQLNRDLVSRDAEQVRFATAAYGIIDCRDHTLRFARAGHPFPFLLRHDGRTESLEPDGGLLGVFPDETFEQIEVKLEVGDRLLLYSDGFEVAFPAGDGSSEEDQRLATTRYCDEFEDLRHGSLAEALHRLECKLDEQAGSLNQRDDLTVVCLSVNPTEAEAPTPQVTHDRRSRPRTPSPAGAA